MTKRIAIAKSIEHAANLNIINDGDNMTTQETKRQISMQEIHNARTKRAMNNLDNNEKTLAKHGGMYTQAEINLFHDLHPYFTAAGVTAIDPGTLTDDKTLELLGMYARYVQEDNYLMIYGVS